MRFDHSPRPGLAALAVALLAGCAGLLPPVPEADGRLCHRAGKPSWHQVTCTRSPVPPAAEALSTLPADAQALTVYVLRGGWGDSRGRLMLSWGGQAVAESVPRSFVRLRLPPGRHSLVSQWDGGRSEADISGAAGEVRFIALEPPAWSWQRPFSWTGLSAEEARERVASARLVADVDGRR